MRPHRRQPTRLPRTGILQARTLEWVAISFSNAWKVKNESEVAQLCLTPSYPMDRSLPGSSVHGSFQARVLDMSRLNHLKSTIINMQVGEKTKKDKWLWYFFSFWHPKQKSSLTHLNIMMYDIDSVVEPRNCEWESDLSVIVWKYYLFLRLMFLFQISCGDLLELTILFYRSIQQGIKIFY